MRAEKTLGELTRDMGYLYGKPLVDLRYGPHDWPPACVNCEDPIYYRGFFRAFGNSVNLEDLADEGCSVRILRQHPRSSLCVIFKHPHGLCVTFKAECHAEACMNFTVQEVFEQLVSPKNLLWRCSISVYCGTYPTREWVSDAALQETTSDITDALHAFNAAKAEELAGFNPEPDQPATNVVPFQKVA